jgi:hypothetical protein
MLKVAKLVEIPARIDPVDRGFPSGFERVKIPDRTEPRQKFGLI